MDGLTDDEIELIRSGENPTRIVTVKGGGVFGLDYEYDECALCCDCSHDNEVWLRTIDRIRAEKQGANEVSRLKETVSGWAMAEFQYARSGHMWYKTDNGFMFPVPFNEVGSAQFNRTEKAFTMMRWIRKQMEEERTK